MKKKVIQKQVFLTSEGDKWFERNQSTDVSPGYRFYTNFLKSDYRILEIGCSDGKNLQYFYKEVGCMCYGIDPSQKAIEFGKREYPELNLSVGTAEQLNFPDGFFDFILFGFCLYLVDRELLSKSVAEADRVLKNKGFLGITDFDSKIPKKRPYKYCPGLISYKMEYTSLFLAFPHFSLADKFCFSHSSDFFVEDTGERVASVMLFKDHTSAYFPEEDRE